MSNQIEGDTIIRDDAGAPRLDAGGTDRRWKDRLLPGAGASAGDAQDQGSPETRVQAGEDNRHEPQVHHHGRAVRRGRPEHHGVERRFDGDQRPASCSCMRFV